MISIYAVLFVGTILRIGLLYDSFGSLILTKYLQSAAVESVLYDPAYTLKNLKEAVFVSSLSEDGVMTDSVQFAWGNLHPMLLLLMDKLLKLVPNDITVRGVEVTEDLVFSVGAILIDFLTACQMYRLAKATFRQTEFMKFEAFLEPLMPTKIYPISANRSYLFGLWFESDDTLQPALFSLSSIPTLCVMIYYLNPFTILTAASGIASIQGIWLLLLVTAMLVSLKGNAITGGACLAILCHLDITYIVFLVPFALLWKNSYQFQSPEFKSKRPSIKLFLVSFVFWFGVANAPLTLTIDAESLKELTMDIYDTTKKLENLSPNLGMYWYLFTNVFERFRPYFVVISSSLLFMFVIPLLFRFGNYPLPMAITCQLLRSLFSPCPTMQDITLALALITLARRTISRMRFMSLLCLYALPVPVILYVIDYYLWLDSGSGNANFMFFQCLAYNLFIGMITIDFVSSTMKRDKAIQMTAKKEGATVESVATM